MRGNELKPGAQTEHLPNSRQQIRSEYYLQEMETILFRIADLFHILAEEIAVFEYFNEKYRLYDTDLDEI